MGSLQPGVVRKRRDADDLRLSHCADTGMYRRSPKQGQDDSEQAHTDEERPESTLAIRWTLPRDGVETIPPANNAINVGWTPATSGQTNAPAAPTRNDAAKTHRLRP